MSTDNEVVPSAPPSPMKSRPNALASPISVGRFIPFEKAHRLDRSSSDRRCESVQDGAPEKIGEDNAPTLACRVKKTDARETESFYRHYYEHNVGAVVQGKQLADRSQLDKAYKTAGVLFEVHCAVHETEIASQS